jgi:NAD(P)H-hydrate epimerase
MNSSGVRILAVDTPSGLDNDTGNVGSPCVEAAATVTMGFPKIGSFFYPAKRYTGALSVKDLGYPQEIVDQNKSGLYLPTADMLKKILPARKPAGSKFDHGLVLVLGGSRGMAGSAVLVSSAVLRSGCGMVFTAAPASLINVLATKLTEAVLESIGETDDGTPSLAALDRLLELASRVDALCIGPGISHHPDTSALVRELVRRVEVPVILDADGINAFKDMGRLLKNHKSELVLTPHAGEWIRLFGELPKDPISAFGALTEKAAFLNATILYKGSPTLLASPDRKGHILPFGNSGMATAGSGDVLSGIITALVAQGCTAVDAGILGAYLHGEAGNAAARKKTEYAMIASDIVENLPEAFMTLIR